MFHYDKNNPSQIGVKSLDLLVLLLPGLGLPFLIMGFLGLVRSIGRKD